MSPWVVMPIISASIRGHTDAAASLADMPCDTKAETDISVAAWTEIEVVCVKIFSPDEYGWCLQPLVEFDYKAVYVKTY